MYLICVNILFVSSFCNGWLHV